MERRASVRRGALGLLAPLLLMLLACSSSAHAPAPAPHSLALPPGAAEVAALRGHAFTRDVPVHEVTRAHMRHVIAAELEAHPRLEEGNEAFLKAFGFIPLASKLSGEANARLEGDALVGLYRPSERAVYVRPRTRTSSAIDADDVVHELAHALQDDVFGMGPMDAPGDDDARLARHAVYEGDATVVAWGVAGMRAGRTAEDAIAEHRLDALAQSATLGASQELEAIPGWAGVPRLTQVEMFFPYSAGSELVAEAFLAGGSALVDGLFRKLPVSTEQVLHAAKYFDGEAPVPVRVPAVPPGYVLRAKGTMGELRIRAFLELGLPTDAAVTASAGWGGDAFAVVARSDTAPLAVLWSTVWDDATHATRFAAALEQATASAPNELGQVAMRVQGTRVAWTRGIDDPAQLDALLALPGVPPPAVPPYGQVVLPSTQVARELLVPAGGDPHLVVAKLGLSSHLPARFASIRAGSSELTIQEVEQHGRGTLVHEAKPFDPSGFPALAASVAPVLSVNIALGRMEITDVALPIGQAKEAHWPFADGTGEARFFAIPLCGGAWTLYVTTVSRSEEARVGLAQWVRSIEPTGPALPTSCGAAP